jgi:hypothetical protein
MGEILANRIRLPNQQTDFNLRELIGKSGKHCGLGYVFLREADHVRDRTSLGNAHA